MKNMLEPKLRRQEELIAKGFGLIPALVVIIIWYLLKLIVKVLRKYAKELYKASLAVFVLYGLCSFFIQVANAPKADASEPYEVKNVYNVELPMKVEPDLKVREIVLSLVAIEFGEDQVDSFDQIVMHESGWNPKAVNPNGGACGLFQALPCSKMGGMELEYQIKFGLSYIKARYGTPNNAWKFWQANHWY